MPEHKSPLNDNLSSITFDTENFSISEFSYDAVTIATKQGRKYALEMIKRALEHPKGGHKEAADTAASLLMVGADDTSSGRGNDLRRAYHDGVRAVATRVVQQYLRVGEVRLSMLERF